QAVGAFESPLEPGRSVRIEPLRLVVRCRLQPIEPAALTKKKRSPAVQLDWDKVEPPLIVRNIRRGDRFAPLGLKGSKKVGDYLTDRKAHRVYRDEIPVVCDSNGIVWLVGYEIADRVKVDAATKRVVEIESRKQRQGPKNAV
ncbi:MAG: tRNA lysidine(34) synthetase TilS, partial [Candidatus Zixiibacteriota bacterium]